MAQTEGASGGGGGRFASPRWASISRFKDTSKTPEHLPHFVPSVRLQPNQVRDWRGKPRGWPPSGSAYVGPRRPQPGPRPR